MRCLRTHVRGGHAALSLFKGRAALHRQDQALRGGKRGPCSRCAPARAIPHFPVWTAESPLIAAWLVGCMRNPSAKDEKAMKQDVYERVTAQIVAALERVTSVNVV